MNGYRVIAPVAFIIFNRPDTTARVFAQVRQVKPRTLLVVADGPRTERANEPEKCAAARAIIEQIDWDCDIRTNYSDTNLGCKRRVASGIDWVFSQVPEAIILEDDCVPDPSFFRFCDELLQHYRDDKRVMSISGNNPRAGRTKTTDSYYFSRDHHIWGWATWRRAWELYDVDMKLWPTIRDAGLLFDIFGPSNKLLVRNWTKNMDKVYSGAFDTWDWQWQLSCWVQNGLSIVPTVNMVSNIGFGPDATHTLDPDNHDAKAALVSATAMDFPLHHPQFMIRQDDGEQIGRLQALRFQLQRVVRQLAGVGS